MPLRVRLTVLYAGLFAASTAVVLGVAFVAFRGHLHATLPADLAGDLTRRLAVQLVIALVGTTLVAVALGRLVAGRALDPIGRVTAAARRVSEDRLDERLALTGPRDEVRELADTFDAMLDRLADSLHAQRQFVANAGHELRTPLTAIRTEAEVTLDDPQATVTDLRTMGARIVEDVATLDGLIDALLVLAHSHAGLEHRTPVPLDDLLTDVAAVSIPAAGTGAGDPAAPPPVLRVTRTGPGPYVVLGDAVLLRHLVRNLLDNAARYASAGGTVAVNLHGDGTVVALRVANPGRRIAAEDAARLDRPFQRLGRHGNGSGLGLSIVRSVTDAHHGTLRIVAPPDGGLDVTVSVPAAR